MAARNGRRRRNGHVDRQKEGRIDVGTPKNVRWNEGDVARNDVVKTNLIETTDFGIDDDTGKWNVRGDRGELNVGHGKKCLR